MRDSVLSEAYITVGAGLVVAALMIIVFGWSTEGVLGFCGGGLLVRGILA